MLPLYSQSHGGRGTYPYAGSGIDQGQLHIISHSYYNRCVYPGLCTAVSGAGDTGGPENYSGTGALPAGNGACGIYGVWAGRILSTQALWE